MGLGKTERLELLMDNLIDEIGRPFKSCVVTNERGLIVAGKTREGKKTLVCSSRGLQIKSI